MKYKTLDRNGKLVNTTDDSLLRFLYDPKHKALIKPLISKRTSDIAGAFCDSPLSASLISPFIKHCHIDLTEYESGKYGSFNEFFTRKIRSEARPVNQSPEILISPCDSKVTAYKINENSIFKIKGSNYSVASFLRCKKLAKKYCGGYFLIFRLDFTDYHRYIYIDNGTKSANVHINGVYHTVKPTALESSDIYHENTREFTILHTENFGNVIHAEVGAMLVGKIKNHHEQYQFNRGEEKGMFEYGGSTVVLIIPPESAVPDKDIIENTQNGYETLVKMGEKVGRKIK